MSTRIPPLKRPAPGTGWPHSLWLPGALLASLALPGAVGAALRWPGLMLAPGAAVYLLAGRRSPRASELALFALALSPLITTLAGVAALASGGSMGAVSMLVTAVSLVACAGALLSGRARMALPDRRSILWLGAILSVLVLLTAFLPMTNAWWRIRSDAWFHAAVVSEIADYGIPPQDPYFAGMALQYMWFYHVLVLVLSRGLDLDPFRVMALLNIQALAVLCIAGWMLAGVFRRALAHRVGVTLMLLLGFNGAFWVFLPVKLVRAVTGDVRGWEEIKRSYSIVPFDYDHACNFVNVYYNGEFFLDKLMVATAFGLALAFMVAGWYAAADYLRTRRPSALVLLAGALGGMLGFHSLVGFVMLVGIFGGAVLAWIFRGRRAAFPLRPVVILLVVSLGAFLAMGPYLYEVMRLKEKEQVFPLSLSMPKTIGIFISSAFALGLFMIRRPLVRERDLHVRFFLFGALAVTVFCLVITLPGPNTYDKLGYFVFVPAAILGGIALTELWLERRGASRRRMAAWVVAFMLPANALAFAGAFRTPGRVEVTPPEARLSQWLRANTSRNAIMIDDHDRVVFLVTVPRRYYWGNQGYAQQWGYPKLEMSRRLHARRALYSAGGLDATALDAFGSVNEPLFAIVRPEHHALRAAVASHPGLFHVVHEEADGYAVIRIDAAACRALSSGRTDHVSPEELIRESGL